MSIAHALPYLILAVVLGAAGYLAGAVTDPFQPEPTGIRSDLAPKALRLSLHRELEQTRNKAASLTSDLERAQNTIDRLRAQLETSRSRIAQLQQRAETAEQARAQAKARIGELAERVAALEAREAGTPTPTDEAARSDTPGRDASDDAGQPADGASPPTSDAPTPDAPTPDALTPDAPGTPQGADDPPGSPQETAADAPPQPDRSTPEPATPGGAGATDGPDQQAKAESANPAQAERAEGDGDSDARDGLGEASASDDSGAADTGAADTGAVDTGAAAQADGAGRQAATGPSGRAQDLRPGANALSPIDPTTRQSNRLASGVEAYQDAAYAEAFRAWLPLAQAGYTRAQLHLGALFLEGRGTDRNDALAYAWLTIARENGSQNARPLLAQLRERMSDADMNTAERLLTRARQTAGNAG